MLSVYLDLRPRASATGHAASRAARPGLRFLKERLRTLEHTLAARGPALDSLRHDIWRIQRYIARDMRPSTQGVAIFGCAARGLFEIVDVDRPFANHVALGPTPDLAQLVQLERDDGHEDKRKDEREDERELAGAARLAP